MALSLSARLGLTRWGAQTDPLRRAQLDADNAALDAVVAMYAQGTFNARPAAGKAGRFYFATDNQTIYYDDGTAWILPPASTNQRVPTDTATASLRAAAMMTGGGTVSASPTFEVKWTERFIVISNGNGSHFSAAGFFDIIMPDVGAVITGVGGAASKTVTAAGVPLASWEALYYILPIGGINSSLPGNFRVVHFTAAAVIPETWILIAARSSNTGEYVRFGNGVNLTAGQSWTPQVPVPSFAQVGGTIADSQLPIAQGRKTFTSAAAGLGSATAGVEVRATAADADPNIYFHKPGVTDAILRLTSAGFVAGSSDGVSLRDFRAAAIYDNGNRVVSTNDARLSDARTPVAHVHAAADVSAILTAAAPLADSGTAAVGVATLAARADHVHPRDDSGWTNLTLNAGWTSFGGGWAPLAYRRLDGVVYLRGMVTSANGSAGSEIATLPAGFRPAFSNIYTIPTGGGHIRFDVNATGVIQPTDNTLWGTWLSTVVSFPLG